jgi:hypothetical protein
MTQRVILIAVIILAVAGIARTIDLSCTAVKVNEVSHRLQESPLSAEQKTEISARADKIIADELQPLYNRANELENEAKNAWPQEVRRITLADLSLQGRDENDPAVQKKVLASPKIQDLNALQLDVQEGLNQVEQELADLALSTPPKNYLERVKSSAAEAASKNGIDITGLDNSKGYKDLLATYNVMLNPVTSTDKNAVVSHALAQLGFDTKIEGTLDVVRPLQLTMKTMDLGTGLLGDHIGMYQTPVELRPGVTNNPTNNLGKTVKKHAARLSQSRGQVSDAARLLKSVKVPPPSPPQPSEGTPKTVPERLDKLADDMKAKAEQVLTVVIHIKGNRKPSAGGPTHEQQSIFAVDSSTGRILLLVGTFMLFAVSRWNRRTRKRAAGKRAARILWKPRRTERDPRHRSEDE